MLGIDVRSFGSREGQELLEPRLAPHEDVDVEDVARRRARVLDAHLVRQRVRMTGREDEVVRRSRVERARRDDEQDEQDGDVPEAH